MELLLEEIAGMHGVFIMAVCQPTHCFDINGCDALLHSAQKRKMRSYPAPLCTEHIIRDWYRACEESCTDRLIQRCFMRALERDADGDVDKSLIPKQVREWYSDSDDEETSSECESEWKWSLKLIMIHVWRILYLFYCSIRKNMCFCQDSSILWGNPWKMKIPIFCQDLCILSGKWVKRFDIQ